MGIVLTGVILDHACEGDSTNWWNNPLMGV